MPFTTSIKAAAIAVQPVIAEAATTAGYIAHDAAVLLWDVATSDEAKALYVRTGKAIAHAAFYLLTLVVWGLVELWSWAKVELPRFAADLREAIATAVADAQAEPLALPWSADVPLASEVDQLAWVMPCATDWAMFETGLTS